MTATPIAGGTICELLKMSPELDALDPPDGPALDHKYSYRELSGLYVLTPRADLPPADRIRADQIAHDDAPNSDLPWVRGELLPYREFRRLFELTDLPAPAEPPEFALVSHQRKPPTTTDVAAALSHDQAGRIFFESLTNADATDPRLGAAHRRLWEDAHPGERYELGARRSAAEPSAVDPGDRAGPHVYSLAEIKARPDLLKPREAVVSHLAYRRRVVLLSAREKAGKSTLLTAAAAAVGTGRDFLGAPTTRGDVLWVSADREDAQDVLERAERFGTNLERFHVYYPRSGSLKDRIEELHAVIAKVPAAWVVVDTLANFVVGVVEKAAQSDDWPRVLLPIRNLASGHNLGVTIVHHAKKAPDGASGGYRDSTAIGASVDVILELERVKSQSSWRKIVATGRWALEGLTMALEDGVYRVVSTGERAAATPAGHRQKEVLDAMGTEEWSVKTLSNKISRSPRRLREDLRALELEGLVAAREVREGRSRTRCYRRVDAPKPDRAAPADLSDVIKGGSA